MSERQKLVLADVDSAAYTALQLRRAIDDGDLDAAAESARMLEAIGCRARRFVKAAQA